MEQAGEEVMEIALKLTNPCDHFAYSYKTKDYEYFSRKDCPACKGLGEVPTEEGKELLEFLRKFYR